MNERQLDSRKRTLRLLVIACMHGGNIEAPMQARYALFEGLLNRVEPLVLLKHATALANHLITKGDTRHGRTFSKRQKSVVSNGLAKDHIMAIPLRALMATFNEDA